MPLHPRAIQVIFLNPNEPSCSQMCLCTFKTLKLDPLQVKHVFNPQTIQIMPSSTQMCLCTPKSFKLGPPQFKYIFAHSIHSNQILINSSDPQYFQVCTIAFHQLKSLFIWIKHPFKHYKYLERHSIKLNTYSSIIKIHIITPGSSLN